MSRCFDMNRKMLREESIYLGYIKAAAFLCRNTYLDNSISDRRAARGSRAMK